MFSLRKMSRILSSSDYCLLESAQVSLKWYQNIFPACIEDGIGVKVLWAKSDFAFIIRQKAHSSKEYEVLIYKVDNIVQALIFRKQHTLPREEVWSKTIQWENEYKLPFSNA